MRILIVDDDSAIIDVICDSINWKKLGITEVKTAFNAEKAKKILKETNVDLVISDIEMPAESGLDLLKWFREEHLPGKFLLLTCHESFAYATEAIKYHAEEYLLKPFNVDMMEMVLQKMIRELTEEKRKNQSIMYGEWFMQNIREINLAFWTGFFTGRIAHTEENLKEELKIRNLSIRSDIQYQLVVTRVTNMEKDFQQMGRDMAAFILENLHSEILCGVPENERVIYFAHRDHLTFITICDAQDAGILKRKCVDLIHKCGNLLTSTLTCCISTACKMADLYDARHRVSEILDKNIMFYGDAFFEDQVVNTSDERQPILQLSLMKEYLDKQNKLAFMDYLKKELNQRMKMRILDGEMLKDVHREIQQAVYAHLAEQGIQVTLLMNDEASVQIAEKAHQSVIDMIRWVNYLLEKVFDYENEVQKQKTMIDKIHAYIQEHYKENIGRNEIGAEFYLVPEYLAKMYKKKTGKTLKDYINEYRLEQAKLLLRDPFRRVSEVAGEVGFDNFSYFSTLFKKYMGMTPNEYRKALKK